MKKILVVQTGFLGDVILSSAVYPNLKELYPGAEISVLTTPLAKGLVENHPEVEKTFVFDKRKSQSGVLGLFKMAKTLKAEKFDAVFSLHKSYRTAGLVWLSGIRERFGFQEAKGRFLYTRTAPRSDQKHDVLRNLCILRNVGLEPEQALQKLSIGFSGEVLAQALEFLQEFRGKYKHLVGVCPGSVWATKRWSAEGFSELVVALQKKGAGVVLIGGPDDRGAADKIVELSGAPVLDLVGKLEIQTSAAVISQLELVVTNDSAPLHMASATGVPCVAIFCATVPEFGYGPWGNQHRIVEVIGLECRPCGRHGGNVCPTGTEACIKNIHASSVEMAVSELLALRERAQGSAGRTN